MSESVILNQFLNIFQGPNTSSPKIGSLAPGTYPVLEVLPGPDADYVKVRVEAYLCSRWMGTTYATVVEDEFPFAPITDGIDPSFFNTTLHRFKGVVYSGSESRYTGPIPGCSVKLMPPKQDNCCTFMEDLIVHAFELAKFPFVWNMDRHSEMMISDSNNLWSPPSAVLTAGLAVPVTSMAALPPPYSLCQGWNITSGRSKGHTFLVVESHRPTRKVLILESNAGGGFSGPGYRGLGGLDQYLDSGVPSNWYEDPQVPTWEQMHEQYPTGIHLARLKVNTP